MVYPIKIREWCRPLAPGDLPQMQALHSALFPLDYEDTFYQTAVRGLDNIFTWAAFTQCARTAATQDPQLYEDTSCVMADTVMS